MSKKGILALVWAPHEGRTASFAERLGAELHNVHFLKARRLWAAPLKYPMQWIATWRLLAKKRPHVVYVTNSPPVAGLCVMTYGWLTGTRFVLDTHPPSLIGRKWGWTRPLQRFTAKRALVNVTDQERFADYFRSWNAPVIVLENPPRLASVPTGAVDVNQHTIVYVGTFAPDEPIEALLDAARKLPDVTIKILGDVSLAKPSWVESAPDNVVFTGYLRGDDYWSELRRAAAVLVLTEHDYSLCGAAQDALKTGSPLVVSDTPTLRGYFTSGTVFVRNEAGAIAEGIRSAILGRAELAEEMTVLGTQMAERWRQNFAALSSLMERAA